MELSTRKEVVYLGKAKENVPFTPVSPDTFSMYIDAYGNLFLNYIDYIPDFSINEKGELAFTPTTESPVPEFFIDENGYLIQRI